MGNPATQGRLCKTLKEMEVGDYIRCTFTAVAAGIVGDFSDLGGTNQVTEELPLTPLTTADGFFYFLKVDKGLLIADRNIQANVSWIEIAMKFNMVKEINSIPVRLRLMTWDEYQKYNVESDLDGNVLKNDQEFVWRRLPNYMMYCGAEVLQDLTQNTAEGLVRDNNARITRATDWQGMINVSARVYCNLYSLYYRPLLEYVDNHKSTTIWY